VRESVGYENQVADGEACLGEDDHDVDGEAAEGPTYGEAEVAEGGEIGEAEDERVLELATGADEEHHAVVGEEGDGEEHEGAHEPAGLLEGVGKAEHACADDGDEDVGEGLGLGGEVAVAGFSQERGVLSRERWDF
jgi:hypothetical protein